MPDPLRIADVAFDPRRVLEVLGAHDVDYVLIGGVAARLHGSPLVTQDLDLTPTRSAENLERLSAALRELNAQLRLPDRDEGLVIDLHPDWFQRMMSMTFVTDAGLVDVVMHPDGIRRTEDLRDTAVDFAVYGLDVHVAALELIVRSKEAAGRPKDLAALPVLRALLAESAPPPRGADGA